MPPFMQHGKQPIAPWVHAANTSRGERNWLHLLCSSAFAQQGPAEQIRERCHPGPTCVAAIVGPRLPAPMMGTAATAGCSGLVKLISAMVLNCCTRGLVARRWSTSLLKMRVS